MDFFSVLCPEFLHFHLFQSDRFRLIPSKVFSTQLSLLSSYSFTSYTLSSCFCKLEESIKKLSTSMSQGMRLACWQESTTSTIFSLIASSSRIFTPQWWTIWDFCSFSFRLEPLTISHMHRSAGWLSRNYFTLCFQWVLQDLSKAETVWSIRFAISCSWFFNRVIFYLI